MDSDSLKYFETLKPLLNENGCIKTAEDFKRIVELTTEMKSLSARSLMMNILGINAHFAQNNANCKKLFLSLLAEGVWNILSEWFVESYHAGHTHFLTLFVKILSVFPITVHLLKCGSIARLLKMVAKLEDKELQTAAKYLLTTWKTFVTNFNIKTKNSENSNKTPSFLDSLSAAVNSNESRKRRKIVDDSPPSKFSPPPTPAIEAVRGETEQLTQPILEDDPPINIEETNGTLEEFYPQTVSPPPEQQTRKLKKSVSFNEHDLEQFFIFEATEQEILEMHGERVCVEFKEARKREFQQERQAIEISKKMTIEQNEIKKEWVRSVLIEDILVSPKGQNSLEKDVQALRESQTLPPIVMDPADAPTTPTEPIDPNDAPLDIVEPEPPNNPPENCVRCTPYWENYFNATLIVPKMFLQNQFHRQPPIEQNFRHRLPLHHPNNNFITRNPMPGEMPPANYVPRPFLPGRRPVKFNPFRPRSNNEKVFVPRYEMPDQNPSTYGTNPPQYPENSIPADDESAPICRNFQRGRCYHGPRCKYRHIKF